MAGRPSTCTPEIVEEICERLSKGEPLATMCRDDHMPAARTVYVWMDSNPAILAAIARARVVGHDVIAASCLEIADTPLEGVETSTDAMGAVTEKRGDMLGHRKLQIETRLKLLAKWDPKRYGERMALTGPDGGAIQTVTTYALPENGRDEPAPDADD